MVEFIIVRHGYSEGNKEKKFSGQMDVALDSVGKLQAESTAKYISENFDVDKIYSSDLLRAYETALPIEAALGINITKCFGLREIDVGKWQGMLIEDVKKQFPESFELYRKNPGCAKFDGGESYAELMMRAKLAFEKIADENEGKTVVVVTHGGVIRTLRAAWSGLGLEDIKDIPHVPNASITVAEYNSGRFELVQIGYTEHLDDRTTEEGIK